MEGINSIDKKEKIIITGGTEGIGRAIVKELSTDNDIVICARTEEKINEIKDKYGVQGTKLDLNDIDKIENFIQNSIKILGKINTVISNAAVAGIKESKDYVFNVNSESQKILINKISSLLRESNGKIVLLTSSQAKNIIKDNSSYGESKKDIEDWLKDFSQKEENKNIQVIFIIPGSVDTRMHEDAINFGGKEIRDRSVKLKESGKLRDPNIIGKIISKISTSGNNFNPETRKYDIPIKQGDTITISDENVKFESENFKDPQV